MSEDLPPEWEVSMFEDENGFYSVFGPGWNDDIQLVAKFRDKQAAQDYADWMMEMP